MRMCICVLAGRRHVPLQRVPRSQQCSMNAQGTADGLLASSAYSSSALGVFVALSWATSAAVVHAWVMSSSIAEGVHQRAT